MKKLRCEIGRLFRHKYIMTVDFENEVRFHKKRSDVLGNSFAYVFDFNRVGRFTLDKDNTVPDHYVHMWFDYEEIRESTPDGIAFKVALTNEVYKRKWLDSIGVPQYYRNLIDL